MKFIPIIYLVFTFLFLFSAKANEEFVIIHSDGELTVLYGSPKDIEESSGWTPFDGQTLIEFSKILEIARNDAHLIVKNSGKERDIYLSSIYWSHTGFPGDPKTQEWFVSIVFSVFGENVRGINDITVYLLPNGGILKPAHK